MLTAEKIKSHFGGKITVHGDINFSSCGEDFYFTDGCVYMVSDGELLPGGSKVRTIKAIEKYIALRV